jgi:hypothetical protein
VFGVAGVHFTVDVPLGSMVRLRGRDALIEDLLRHARHPSGADSAHPIHVLYGLGGCGKSMVAREVAGRLSRQSWLTWWVSAKDSARISASLREITGRLGAPASQLDLAWSGKSHNPVDLLWDLLDASPKPWLLVFDNADDPTLVTSAGPAGTGWLRRPRTRRGLVLVTTRDGSAEFWGDATRHPVEQLSADDAAQVLIDLAGTTPGTWQQARELGRRLRGHPLALRGAGTYLSEANSPGSTTGIRTYEEYHEALGQPTGNSGLERAMRRLFQSWELSLDLLARRGLPQARPLLRLLAWFGDAPIPYQVLLDPRRMSASPLVPIASDEQRAAVLRGLADFALIDLSELADVPPTAEVRSVVSMHPLVRELNRTLGEASVHRGEYLELVFHLLDGLRPRDPDRPREEEFDPDEPGKWVSWHVLSPPTSGAVLEFLEQEGPHQERSDLRVIALDLARLIARYTLAVGLPHQAANFLDRCLNACRRPGPDAEERPLLRLRHERARAAPEQGDLAFAEREPREIGRASDTERQ